jgi:hypothetical protein
VDAGRDEPVDVAIERGGVDLGAVGGEGGDKGDEDAGEVGVGHVMPFSIELDADQVQTV